MPIIEQTREYRVYLAEKNLRHRVNKTTYFLLLILNIDPYGSGLVLLDIALISCLDVGSLKAKIGNYKSVAGVTGKSNASKNTKFIYGKYGHLSSGEIWGVLKVEID